MKKPKYESPVIFEIEKNRVEIKLKDPKQTLATFRLGDDTMVERIADILSSKGLKREAMKLRQLMMDARKPVGRGVW